jgi:glyoxylase-like metal-dependent hydrolase (beta-lactamase superfamily II)
MMQPSHMDELIRKDREQKAAARAMLAALEFLRLRVISHDTLLPSHMRQIMDAIAAAKAAGITPEEP